MKKEEKKTKKTRIGRKKQGAKAKKKREQEKIEKEQLWYKVNTLNKEFRAIGNIKKTKKNVKDNIKINCSIDFEIFVTVIINMLSFNNNEFTSLPTGKLYGKTKTKKI